MRMLLAISLMAWMGSAGARSLGNETRLSPLQILTWHEIANDVVGGIPVAVTFCPLCNSGLAFDRRVPVTPDEAERLDIDSPPFLFEGSTDGRLAAKERVVTVDGNEPVAYPFSLLRRERVIHDEADGDPLVVFWQPGTASALDAASVVEGADVGAIGAFHRRLGSRTLEFAWAAFRPGTRIHAVGGPNPAAP